MASDPSTNASARHVFATLRLAATAEEALSIAEISRRLGVTVNKAYRAIATLDAASYLRRNPLSGKYEAGPAAQGLVQALLERFAIRAASIPYLRQIATACEATTSLDLRLGWFVVRLALVEGGATVVSRARRIGRPALLHREVPGRAILAGLADDAIIRFRKYVVRSHPEAAEGALAFALERDIAAIRADGFAFARGEQADALALPLCDGQGAPVAAITIESPRARPVPLNRDPLLGEWLAMVRQFEAAVRARDAAFANPYAAIDPDLIRFAPEHEAE